MSEQKPDNLKIDEMYNCVRRFQEELGNGKKSKKVLVGDSPDARTSTFRFVGNIHHNWPSWNEVRIRTPGGRTKIFCTATQTVNGSPAYMFFYNELTETLYLEQVERQKLLTWFETAVSVEPRNSIAMIELALELTKSTYRVETYAELARVNWKQFQIEIRKLNLSALRKLNSLTGLRDSLNPSEPAKAA